MKKLRQSLLIQYVLIILVATMFIPITVPALSILFFNFTPEDDSSDRYYNGTDIEQMWSSTAKELGGATEEQIRDKFLEMKGIYPEASLYFIDEEGQNRLKYPESLEIPQHWSASYAVDFMKKNRGGEVDPFTVVSFIGDDQGEGFIVLQIPRSDMVSPSSINGELYNYFIIGTFILILIGFIVISTLFFYRIRKRLLHLQKVMDTSEGNSIPSAVEVKHQDEIGRLGQSFNRMVEELETGRKREQEEEKLRKELIANLSHDLRTPLTTIRGHAYRLKKESLSEDGQESVDLIDEKVNFMAELMENLLSYTLLHAGKYPYHPEEVDIVRLIRTSFAGWYPIFENMKFKIELEIPDERIVWNIDPQWFHRILDNFFQNVYRHAGNGRYVGIKIENRSVIIEDRGPGMSAQSGKKGAGVGLSVVSLMLKEMQLNWDIDTSEQGTTMKITPK
ncbi:HAMP domain-containing sensor histidine kinase [Psychrobacillus vulpis]|uniref:histidine kinase n=1 Tax=Psychrobacillus vulpis TaxID=2325572 RepID=A0A544TU57_9BACI|nr:HAMP domain-containing sensor histidine kinase [Psychrobacillus vulpis]TQR20974.1 HAMP domain-containing histidine kinase [Psychrobacillus vulpis]